jgi:hypothetical protein
MPKRTYHAQQIGGTKSAYRRLSDAGVRSRRWRGRCVLSEATNTEGLEVLVLPPGPSAGPGYQAAFQESLQAALGSSSLKAPVWPVHLTLPEGNRLMSKLIICVTNTCLQPTY